jgi:hypothetical protein
VNPALHTHARLEELDAGDVASTRHAVHAVAPALEYEPCAQAAQVELPAAELDPA